jgi:hypothetical protein
MNGSSEYFILQMTYRQLKRKLGKEPLYIYSEYKECAMRTEIVNGETVYFLKFKDRHEIKAIYSSKLVAEALLGDPEIITPEEYERY